jgi:DNA replication and repair protein RecF
MSALPSLHIGSILPSRLRNLELDRPLELAPRLNVFHGDNGQGKSSLLEAIYLVCTSKSFRTTKLREVVRHGSDDAQIDARIVERRPGLEPFARDQRLRIEGARVRASIDDRPATSLAHYATRTPVVVFHPEELRLSTGPAAGRRRLLDRIALFTSPSSARLLTDYTRALRERQELLRRGVLRGDTIDAFEQQTAELGAAITRARAEVVTELAAEVLAAFARIADPTLVLSLRYGPGGAPNAADARAELERRRPRDARAPSATFGPHRDDLLLELGGHPARLVASQGQHRALTLSLKAAESRLLERLTGLTPIQLLDDVSSELDPTRSKALYTFLREAQGQVFLTTPRPELVEGPFEAVERSSFHILAGRVGLA